MVHQHRRHEGEWLDSSVLCALCVNLHQLQPVHPLCMHGHRHMHHIKARLQTRESVLRTEEADSAITLCLHVLAAVSRFSRWRR